MFSHVSIILFVIWFFVFKQKTAYVMRISDWSSDVCSSDLNRRDALPLFSAGDARRAAIPEGLRDMLPPGAVPAHLQTLEQAGIRVSQGLRSGCNRFFYVTLAGDDEGETVTVEASDSFQNMRFRVPADALRPEIGRASCRERVCQYV